MATYYLDATAGDDTKDGLSAASAWQTIGKVNGATFSAGDSILLKRGETWAGTQLIVPDSGSVGNHIVFADYGSGALPVIDGNDTVNCCICTRDYITFQNMRLIDGLNFGLELSGCDYVNVYDCEMDGCGNDNVLVDGAAFVNIARITSTNPYERVGGPAITCIEIIDGSHDVEFYNSVLSGSENYGLSIHCHGGETYPYNVFVHNISSTNNDEHGLHINKADAGVIADRNVLISDCDFSNNTMANVVIRSAGGQRLPGITIRNCIAVGSVEYPLYIVQDGDATIQNCVFEGAWPTYVSDAGEVTIHNCTFYRPSAATIVLTVLTGVVALEIRNCIFYNDGATILRVDPVVGIDMDYNLYYCTGANPVTGIVYKWGGGAWSNWANWKINSGQDANSPMPADPLFTDVANDRFYLQHGSPALNVGTPLAGRSFYGAAPDCGRWEMRWPSTRTHQQMSPQWDGS